MKLSENLRRIRKDNNLSQEQLAEKLGVSRQAVSKWESGQSYPEMDKVLLICKTFNYNIDELMNENIKEVEENKESKRNINKYIEDFFGFITKTVDMFSSMKLKSKIKCLVEQCIIALVLLVIFAFFGEILNSILYALIGALPDTIYYTIQNILSSLYLVLSIVLGGAILLHVYKIRYLDYYEIIREEVSENIADSDESCDVIEDINNKKIYLEKKKEKIIIRDPKHSQSKFLSGLIEFILLCLKIMIAFIAMWFAISFIGLIIFLVVSFAFIKTGMVFVGSLLTLISAITINYLFLEWFYNFIVSKKNNKNRIAIMLIISLICCGVGIGLIILGITDFNYINNVPEKYLKEDVYEFEMKDNLSINSYYGFNNSTFVEEDIANVKVKVKYMSCQDLYYYIDEKNTIFLRVGLGNDVMNFLRNIIKDINNKELTNYDYIPTTTIYASKENIDKIKQATINKMEQEKQDEIDNLNYRINELEGKINEAESEIYIQQNKVDEKENRIVELENLILEKESEIIELKNQINNMQLVINNNY